MLIYRLRNKINDKSYIGQAKSFVRRLSRHKWEANNNSLLPIHCAIRKYGIENFEIEKLHENLNKYEYTNSLEKFYIQIFNTISPNGYNISDGGSCGPTHPSTREKISRANKGRVLSPEQRAKIGNGIRGLKRSEEDRHNKSLALKGRRPSEECMRQSKLALTGKKYTPERIAQYSKKFSDSGNPAFRHDISSDTIKELLEQKYKPNEIAAKLNAPYLLIYRRCRKLGLKPLCSEESVAKRKEAMIKHWAKKKAASDA